MLLEWPIGIQKYLDMYFGDYIKYISKVEHEERFQMLKKVMSYLRIENETV